MRARIYRLDCALDECHFPKSGFVSCGGLIDPIGRARLPRFEAQLRAELPEEPFERFMAAGVSSLKGRANVALALRRGNSADMERCPHCGHVLRVREHVNQSTRDIVNAWLEEQADGEPKSA